MCAAASSGEAQAKTNPAYIVTRPDPAVQQSASPARELRLHSDRSGAYLIVRPVVEPAVTVGRALAQQPTRPDLAQVSVGVTTIYVDPDRNYTDGTRSRLDDNHTLVRAQRLFNAIHARPARVIVNQQAHAAAGESAAGQPQPRMIIDARALRRQLQLNESPSTDPNAAPVPMPSTPANPQQNPATPQNDAGDHLMARSE